MTVHIGLIGFGEAGEHLGRGLAGAGATVVAFDRLIGDPAAAPGLRARAAAAGVETVPTLVDLLDRCRTVLSVVVAGVALEVAREAAPALKSEHLYVDLNSVAPSTKRAIGEVVSARGGGFAEGAVMAAVPPHGHRVPILLAGPGADDAATRLAPYGMQLDVLGPDVGAASAAKIFRSVLIKGVESVLFECLAGARAHGVEARVLASAGASMSDFDWTAWADYTLGRMAAHAGRRGQEMEEAAAALEDAGVEPLVTRAAAERLRRIAALGPLDLGGGGAGAVLDAVARAADPAVRPHPPGTPRTTPTPTRSPEPT